MRQGRSHPGDSDKTGGRGVLGRRCKLQQELRFKGGEDRLVRDGNRENLCLEEKVGEAVPSRDSRPGFHWRNGTFRGQRVTEALKGDRGENGPANANSHGKEWAPL